MQTHIKTKEVIKFNIKLFSIYRIYILIIKIMN